MALKSLSLEAEGLKIFLFSMPSSLSDITRIDPLFINHLVFSLSTNYWLRHEVMNQM